MKMDYAVYEAGSDHTAGGYDLKFPNGINWLDDKLRKEVFKHIASIKRDVTANNIDDLIYQGMISFPGEFNKRLIVYCWIDYSFSRPMARYLIIKPMQLRLNLISLISQNIIKHPNDWLQLKVDSANNIMLGNDNFETNYIMQLKVLDAIMTKPYIIIPPPYDKNSGKAMIWFLSVIPDYLFPNLLIGHNLNKIPSKTKSGIILGHNIRNKQSLNVQDYEPGPIFNIGKILFNNLNYSNFDSVIRLSWELYHSNDTRRFALKELKNTLGVENWQLINNLHKSNVIARLHYKNRKIF